MTLVVLLTHAAAFVLGALTTYVFVLAEMRRSVTPPVEEAPVRRRYHMFEALVARFEAPAIVVCVLLVLVSSVFALVSQQQISRQTDCMNNYANSLADSQVPRQIAAERLYDADTAFTKAIVAVLTPGNNERDIEALRKASLDKQRVQLRLDEERITNPYPDPPREVC